MLQFWYRWWWYLYSDGATSADNVSADTGGGSSWLMAPLVLVIVVLAPLGLVAL
jgi:hypothetical protein